MTLSKRCEVKAARSCPSLGDTMAYRVHGILQGRDQPNNEPTWGSGAAEEKGNLSLRNKVGIRGLMPFAGKSPCPNPCMPFIANISFLVCALERSVFYNLGSGIKIYNAQSSMSNLQAISQWRPFSATPPSLWLWQRSLLVFHQSHQCFNILFARCFSTMYFLLAPSLLPGGDEKVILIFQRSPVNYSTALCIAYSLQVTFFIKMRKLRSILTILRAFARKLVQDYLVLVCFTLFLFPSIYIFLTHWRFDAILHWTSL